MVPKIRFVDVVPHRHLTTVLARSQPVEREPFELLIPQPTLASSRLLYATAGAPAHDWPGHAECAERVPAILSALDTYGMSSHSKVVELTGFGLAGPEHIAPCTTSATWRRWSGPARWRQTCRGRLWSRRRHT